MQCKLFPSYSYTSTTPLQSFPKTNVITCSYSCGPDYMTVVYGSLYSSLPSVLSAQGFSMDNHVLTKLLGHWPCMGIISWVEPASLQNASATAVILSRPAKSTIPVAPLLNTYSNTYFCRLTPFTFNSNAPATGKGGIQSGTIQR